jgi:2-oxoglutarate ferredoxin oxidoreductase subunit beta
MSPVDALKRLREDMIPYYPLGIYKDADIHNNIEGAN